MAATLASRNLAYSNAMLQSSLVRLSTGSRVVQASDDAGGVAVAMKLSAAAKRMAVASASVSNTTSYLQQQDANLISASRILSRVSELWTLYQDGTKTSTDKAGYNVEYQALQQSLAALPSETFNGIALFGSSNSGVIESVRVSDDATVTLIAKNLADSTTGVGAIADSAGAGSLASLTLGTVDRAIENVSGMRANNGAEQSRLDFVGESLSVNRANLEAAQSRIMDVDVADESTQLARWSLLVESGSAMLAQANQSAQLALRLIQ
jgi:flagellin